MTVQILSDAKRNGSSRTCTFRIPRHVAVCDVRSSGADEAGAETVCEIPEDSGGRRFFDAPVLCLCALLRERGFGARASASDPSGDTPRGACSAIGRHGPSIWENGEFRWEKTGSSGKGSHAAVPFLGVVSPQRVVQLWFRGKGVYPSGGSPQATARRPAGKPDLQVYPSGGSPQATALRSPVRQSSGVYPSGGSPQATAGG